jgi:hypothetical protein
MAVKVSDLTTESAPASTDILVIADPTTGLAKKITVSALKTYMDGLGGGGDATAPVVVSATATSGSTIVIVFSESVTVTTSGWSFKINGSAWGISSLTGSGATWTFTMSTSAISTDTILRSYSSTTGGTVDSSANELVTFTDQAVTNSIPSNQLNIPGSFTATVASTSQINLSWTDVANESSYRIDRSTDNTNWTQIGGTISAGTTSYNATGLSTGTLYYFRIKAVGDGVTYIDSGYATDSETTAALADVNFTSATNLTNSSGIWTATAGAATGLAAISIAPSTEGILQMEWNSTDNDFAVIGLDPDNTEEVYTSMKYGVYTDASSFIKLVEAGAAGGIGTGSSGGGVTATTGMLIRLRRAAGGTMYVEYSTNSGASWLEYHVFATTDTSRMYLKVNCVNSGDVCRYPKQSGAA